MTELMLRLIKNGKIVGYMRWHNGDFYTLPVDGDLNGSFAQWLYYDSSGSPTSTCNIDHDSFEFGIKVGGEWFFSGDLLDYGDGIPRELHLFIGCLGGLEHAKLIGTIHDEVTL